MLDVHFIGSKWDGIAYAASIWDPVSKGDIRELEMVQRKAARWAKSCFSQSASVTKMLQDLKWDDLADKRKNIRLTILYKICNKNVDIEFSEIGLISSTRPSRRHQEQFFRLRANTDVLKNSFGKTCLIVRLNVRTKDRNCRSNS